MRLQVPRGAARTARMHTAAIPRTLAELETRTGPLMYRDVNAELANYLLINRLLLVKTVRATVQRSAVFQNHATTFAPLVNTSKYFNYRIYMHEHFRDVPEKRLENFPAVFRGTDRRIDAHHLQHLQRIFDKYDTDSGYESVQQLLGEVVQFLVQLDARPTYQLHSKLAENFERLQLGSISTQVLDSMCRLPGEFANFKDNDNYLLPTDEEAFVLALRQIHSLAYPAEFKAMLDIVSLGSTNTLSAEQDAHWLNPVPNSDVTPFALSKGRKRMRALRTRFFTTLKDAQIPLGNGDHHTVDIAAPVMSSHTMLWLLRTALKLNKHAFFKLLLRKWIFNGVITSEGQLKIFLHSNITPDAAKAYKNLTSVRAYAVLFNKDLMKEVLKYCYISKDRKVFSWILSVLKKAFLPNHMLYLKYTYELEVVDNELVSLVWLNCKNLDHEVYSTWTLLDSIFELDKIFNDYHRQAFVAMNCK